MSVVELLINYSTRVAPGILVAVAFLSMLPRRLMVVRMFGYILAFILIRDTITPLNVWWFGSGWTPWLRMESDPPLVLTVGAVCVAITVTMNAIEPELARLIVWFRGNKWVAVAGGLLGAVVVFAPFIAIYSRIPIAERGGSVETAHWVPLALMCLMINFYEETLFRGYLQGYLEAHVTHVRAALLSGFAFALGHTFLATTVTDTPWLIAFTLYEGLIAAFVRMRFGVVASVLTHGLGIFPLAAGTF